MREDVLFFLKDHPGYLSGEDIAARLKISRASIWKNIQELRNFGYHIDAVPHLGYRLASVPDKLYPWEVTHNLNTRFLGKHYEYHDTLDSTNEAAFRKALAHCPEGLVIAAEHQKKGRGRFNRVWESPKGKGLYFSFVLKPSLSPSEVSKLTLAVSVGCLRALSEVAELKCSVKWPNDILVQRRKLCGILTEIHSDQDTVHFVVVGVGINVHAAEKQLPENATSIFVETGRKILRQELFRKTLEEIESVYLLLIKEGFGAIRQEWCKSCSLWGKRIRVQRLHTAIEGQALDIDAEGSLIIRTDFGLLEKVLSGDIATLEA